MTRISDFVAGRTIPELYETYLVPGLFDRWAPDLAAHAEPGMSCLDVACGTGALTRAILERTQGRCSIKAVDVAPPMIAHAEKAVAAEDSAVEFYLASADALPFPDDSFDVALCQQGLQFFPDKLGALGEIRRVMKPGATLALSVWRAADDGNSVFAVFEDSIARHFGADLRPLGPFSFGDAGELETIATRAGFDVRALEAVSKTVRLPPIEDFVLFDILLIGRPGADGSLQPAVAADDPKGDAVIDALISEMRAALDEFIDSDGFVNAPMTANILTARA